VALSIGPFYAERPSWRVARGEVGSILRSVSSSRTSRRVSSDRVSLGLSRLMVAYWPPAICHTAQDFAVPEPIGRTVNAARSVNFDYPLFGILLRLMICGRGHVLLICQRDRKCAAFAHAQFERVTRTLARGAGSVHSCSPICRIICEWPGRLRELNRAAATPWWKITVNYTF